MHHKQHIENIKRRIGTCNTRACSQQHQQQQQQRRRYNSNNNKIAY